ncbi:MAG: chemotaxis protein CheD [Terriglobia bacterium]
MLDTEIELKEVYLQPGEAYLARRPTIIRTILGSCVGVTLWSSRLGCGALCHALLPKCPGTPRNGFTLADGYRYVDFSIRDLARQFDELGAFRGEVEVKLFGGSDVLPIGGGVARPATVGRQNCEVAVELVEAEGFRLAASSLGGTRGRHIQFNSSTGEVQLRWLARAVLDGSCE